MMIRTADMQDRNFDGIDDRDQPINMGRGFPGGPPLLPVQNMRPRPPLGIGSFPNPFGGFMGGGRGGFMQPQIPRYGIGFGGFGGYGMQPPMFGGRGYGGYGMPPMFGGGGMYGGGFSMQPPIFSGGFGNPFSPSFYGGIGGMFPGMGGGYGGGFQRPPSFGGIGGGFNPGFLKPAPGTGMISRPSPIEPIDVGRPPVVGGPVPIRGPQPVKVGGPATGGLTNKKSIANRDATPIYETQGPSNLMRQRGGPIPLAQQQMNYPF